VKAASLNSSKGTHRPIGSRSIPARQQARRTEVVMALHVALSHVSENMLNVRGSKIHRTPLRQEVLRPM